MPSSLLSSDRKRASRYRCKATMTEEPNRWSRKVTEVTFYENRAGRNLSSERRATLEEAKTIVRESV